MCASLVALATGALFLALSREIRGDDLLRFAPYVSLVLFAVTPAAAAWFSASPTWYASGAGGLAVGIAITVAAASLNSGGTGVMPLTLGIAVGGIIGLRADSHAAIYLRLVVTALLAIYAVASGRIVTLVFVYPLLGFADEFADIFRSRAKPRRDREAATTS
jgi:hypothetical protein